MAFIGFGLLVVALGSMEFLRAHAMHLAQERAPTVNASLRALGGVQRSIAELSAWVAFGDESFQKGRAAAWTHEIEPAIADLRRADKHWKGTEPDRLTKFESMMEQLRTVQARVEELALASNGSQVRAEVEALMAQQVIPQGKRLSSFLRGISSGEMALMRADAESISVISFVGILLSVVLLVGMAVLAAVASTRGAEEITKPIRRLVLATEDLAAGRLTEDIPVMEDDEIGELTAAFNVMRASLVEATESIRQTANQLTDATAQILASTTQQAKGTREQTVAIRTTVNTVQEVAVVADTVVGKAKIVAASVQSASSLSAAGRRAMDEWVTGITELQAQIEAAGDGRSSRVNGSRELFEQLKANMAQICQAMESFDSLLAEADRLAAETGTAIQGQAAQLGEARRAMLRVDDLAEHTFDRTIRVEHVAQELKARSRALRELLVSYSMYAPRLSGQEKP